MSERREWIDRAHASLSVRQQCELLGLARSSWYYEPVPDSDRNLRLMRLIDEQYLSRPYFGQRRMTIWLRQQGHLVNVKRVRRLMQIMGLEAIHPGPRLSLTSPEHRVFPYLLRGVTIDRPDQVWSTDITYVPLARGFLYLVAVIDWFSRKVLSWELSNSMEVGFCVSALESALSAGQPEIFNTDQGSQFTSPQFTSVLSSRGIAISMDGRGRALDNVFIERFWRTLKYEDIYLKAYAAGDDLFAGLTEYITFYNDARPHMSLSYRTPSEVYLAT